MNLFKLDNTATFSKDKKYRYYLTRQWDLNKPTVMFIGLNPSVVNEVKNDPTIRRCIGFAQSWGYGKMYMTNLFTYVSTDPNELITSGEDLNQANNILMDCSKLSDKVIFAWGCFKQHKKRMDEVIEMFPNAWCIKKSKEGFPCHPLYLNGSLKPILFK